MAKIAHLTSAHPRFDTRIFHKQCLTLAEQGHEVSLVVADGAGAIRADGINIVDVGRLSGRLNRMVHTTRRVLATARALDADIYQFHDPELIPCGLRLKQLGKKVVFDSHEDVPVQLLSKPYLGKVSGQLLSRGFGAYERYACRRFDGIIAATDIIRDKFLSINPATVDVNNFPLLREFTEPAGWADKACEVCYVGNISAIRGIRELVRACELLRSPARLSLAGAFGESSLEAEVTAYPGWARVTPHGHLDRAGVGRVIGRAVAGVVTLHPVPSYIECMPVKMFEYMAAGIPVIASNYPRWRAIVEGNDCGVCVDALDPAAIAAAMDHFVTHPELAKRMGENGRRAVLEKYNWQPEARKLIDFYARL
ncbi:MAG: glycosyltransferase family 4 protein [Telluria sp.]